MEERTDAPGGTHAELTRSKLVIAVAQIEGPLPNGKHVSIVDGRETFVWKSRRDLDARVSKAKTILESLNSEHPDLDIVIFPEYSLPISLDPVLEALQQASKQHNQIIIAGADNIYDPVSSAIHTRCPLILPGLEEPIWFDKHQLSQWEYGYIDKALEWDPAVIWWASRGEHYWFSVSVCLDVAASIADVRSRIEHPGILFVPMCSPDMRTLRTYADVLLRQDAGRAVVLCNAVGGTSVGSSSLVAVTPDGRPLQPVLEMSDTGEGVVVFELDCRELSPPRKTPVRTRSAVGKRVHYDVRELADGFTIVRTGAMAREAYARGVINPAIFELCGKRMRIAFLQVESYPALVQASESGGFETLAILGHHDTMVTHLADEVHTMISDVTNRIPYKTFTHERIVTSDGKILDERMVDTFPRFQVDTFYKVLGVPVGPEDRRVFDDASRPIPTGEELHQLFALGRDWNDQSISDEIRSKFLENRWVLGPTARAPGEINTIMTVGLDYPGEDLSGPMDIFEDRVLPALVEMDVVTSAYGGTPTRVSFQYVLRVTANVGHLFDLIAKVHELAKAAHLLVTTTTYVVVQRLNDLSLGESCLVPALRADDDFYRAKRILPSLSHADRARLLSMEASRQQRLISLFRSMEEAVSEVAGNSDLHDELIGLRSKWAAGLLHEDFAALKETHNILQSQVEGILRSYIEDCMSDERLDELRGDLNIPKGKSLQTLTYTERIRVANFCSEHGASRESEIPSVEALPGTTVVRNALAHDDYEKLTLDTYVAAIRTYAAFLSDAGS